LGGQVSLIGADFLDASKRSAEKGSDQLFRPGETMNLRLFWRAQSFMYTDYTAFVHLVGPDGKLVAQQDQRPLAGFIPTSYWPPRQMIADDYEVQIPTDAPHGDYQVHVGMYDLATLQRLPIIRDGQPAGDSIVVATVHILDF
jgi:hypothetical protein